MRNFLGAFLIEIRHYDVRALACQQQRHFASDSAGASDDEDDLAAEFGFGGHAL